MLTIRPYRALTDADAAGLIDEGERLLAFMDQEAVDRRIEIERPLADETAV